MTLRGIAFILGILLLFLAVALLLPLPFSFYYRDGAHGALLISAGVTALTGGLMVLLGKKADRVRARDGFLVVFLAWMLYTIFSAVPYLISGSIPRLADAFFESMSGLTTTGSTILQDIEALPESILFWRGLTHWIGGMGIIVLSLAVLPFLGAGGSQLFKTEVPGPTAEKLTPRIAETTKILTSVYLVLTTILTVLLLFGGMNLMDALCHSFSTIATGGFSTRNASLGAFESAYIEWVVTGFMFLAGCSFLLHFRFITGDWKVWFGNREFLLYCSIIFFVVVLICFDPLTQAEVGWWTALRDVMFQTVAIITTTGFGTADYEGWATSSQVLIFFLMFIGGCAGSTAGGMKVIRVLILFKYIVREITRLLHSHAVVPVRVGKNSIPNDVVGNLLGFFVLFICTFCAGTFFLCLSGIDLLTALSASIAALGNIGPGFGTVGPTENFAHFTDFAKLVMGMLMLGGRLEIFAVIIFLSPEFWKK